MKPQLDLLRAISSEFANRKLKSIVLIFAVLAAIVLAVAIWLTTVSPWWWFLSGLVIVLVVLGSVACAVARIIVRMVRPSLTLSQTVAVAKFVDKLERVAENVQTPMFMIVFYVVRDIVRPRDKPFMQTLIGDGTTLRSDLADLQRTFR